jgi:hypothetical protein
MIRMSVRLKPESLLTWEAAASAVRSALRWSWSWAKSGCTNRSATAPYAASTRAFIEAFLYVGGNAAGFLTVRAGDVQDSSTCTNRVSVPSGWRRRSEEQVEGEEQSLAE